MPYEFKLPDIGEGLHEAEVVRWLVNKGDHIEADQPVAEIQTDKTTVEISSPIGGRVLSLAGEEGAVVEVGETLVSLEEGSGESVPQSSSTEKKAAAEQAKKPSKKRVIAAPVVRKRARELSIDIAEVTGSAKGGRIVEADLHRYLEQQQQQKTEPAPTMNNSTSQEDERIPIRGLRKKIAENMVRSAYTAPQVSGMDEIDVTRLVEARKSIVSHLEKDGVKFTFLPLIVKAVTRALKELPIFNASVDEQTNEMVLKKRINIGIATATKEGLVVPVVKNADQKSIYDLAVEIEQLVEKAHQQKLTLDDIQDGTFTITSTGAGGGWYATPMVNYPEVAIFGAHAIKKKPVVVNDEIVIRQMMGISITFDHRVIDGEPAGRFMQVVSDILGSPEMLLLDVR